MRCSEKEEYLVSGSRTPLSGGWMPVSSEEMLGEQTKTPAGKVTEQENRVTYTCIQRPLFQGKIFTVLA